MKERKSLKFLCMIILSLLAHGLLLFIFEGPKRHYNHSKPIPIEFEEMKKLYGEEKGKKEFNMKFSAPGEEARRNQEGENLKMPSAQPEQQEESAQENKNQSIHITKGHEGDFSAVQVIKKSHLQKEFLQALSFDPKDATILKMANINMNFVPPEGFKEDELNSFEKIFYAYQKKSYITYVNSFLKAYREIVVTRPNLERNFQKANDVMTARVTFDSEGNVVSIKILKWSLDDDLENLFEKTLGNIISIPNPPKAFTQKDGHFMGYFQLIINSPN